MAQPPDAQASTAGGANADGTRSPPHDKGTGREPARARHPHPDLRALEDHVTRAIHTAVTGLRTAGYSWAEIGNRLGITRQAAQQRFGPTDTTGSTP